MTDHCTFVPIRYQVAVIVPESGEILACDSASAPMLPSFVIPPNERVCEQLQIAFKAKWSLPVYLTDILQGESVGETPLWVAEPLKGAAAAGLTPFPIEDVRADSLTGHTRAKLRSYINLGPHGSPTSRIGWIVEVGRWIEQVTHDAPLPASSIKQYNGGGGFNLLQWEGQSGRRYWVKSVGPPNLHEFAITSFICNLAPRVSPLVLATRPEWNAWLMLEDEAAIAGCRPSLDSAVEALVEVQGRSTGHVEDLLDRGAFDQRSERVEEHLAILFDYLHESMHMQESTRAPRLSREELEEIRGIILRSLDLTKRVPASLLHGDLTGGNVSGHADRCRFLDWCESYVGFAPISLHHLAMLYSRDRMATTDIAGATELYRRHWQAEFGVEISSSTFACAPLLAAWSAAYGRGIWLHSETERSRPQRRSYSRTLARHMAREAHLLQERGELCHY